MRKIQKYRATIHAKGLELPVDIILEAREGFRFGIRGPRIIMRLTRGASPDVIHQKLAELQTWVQGVLEKKPALRQAFEVKTYHSGQVLHIGGRQYVLDLRDEDRGSHTAKLIGNTIHLQLSNQSTPANRTKAIKTLLSRVVAGDFQAEITRRVLDWNDRTVRQHVRSVNLKYNHSNWGSCSRDRNVNLSTRLLFAPTEVQDYVILHELAHLVELNHSDRFWAIVERYMPDYHQKERWLKANREKCDF
jgi:predicted metal-dependent hydrolase